MAASRYETTNLKIFAAIVAGAASGAAINCVYYLDGLFETNGKEHFYQYAFSKGLTVFVVALVFWTVGLCVAGGPVWLVLHRKNRRRLRDAVLAGAVVPFLVVLAWATQMFSGRSSGFSLRDSRGWQWESGVLTMYGWYIAFQTALEYAVYGCLIGAIVWFIAYRKVVVADPS